MAKRWIRLILTSAMVTVCLLVAACGRNLPQPGNVVSPTGSAGGATTGGVADTGASASSSSVSGIPAGTASASGSAPGSTGAHPSATTQPSRGDSPSPSVSTPGPSSSVQASPSHSPSLSPSSAKPSPEPVRNVTLSVTGNAQWGTILKSEGVAWKKNETVSDVLIRTLKAHKLSYDARGSGALFYVAGIDGLFEFDDGPTSGWKYRVNGTVQGVGAGSYALKPGDRIEWFYTSDDQAAKEDGLGKGTSP